MLKSVFNRTLKVFTAEQILHNTLESTHVLEIYRLFFMKYRNINSATIYFYLHFQVIAFMKYASNGAIIFSPKLIFYSVKTNNITTRPQPLIFQT